MRRHVDMMESGNSIPIMNITGGHYVPAAPVFAPRSPKLLRLVWVSFDLSDVRLPFPRLLAGMLPSVCCAVGFVWLVHHWCQLHSAVVHSVS